MKKFLTFLGKLLSNDDSNVSFGHVASFFVILYIAAMTTYLMLTAKQPLASIPDFPQGWVYIVAALWGSQKATEIFAKKGACSNEPS